MSSKKNFRIGDKVKFLNEKGGGIVSKITTEYIYVDSDGFELPMLHSELIIIDANKEDKELNKREDVIEDIEVVKKSITSISNKLSKGIYLAFSPINQNILLSGDIGIYLINYTKTKGFYSIFLEENRQYKMVYTGNFETATASLIDTINRNETSKFSNIIFQCIFSDVVEHSVPQPFSCNIEIKRSRFLKEDMYIFNPIISLNSVTVQLMRFDEINYISNVNDKGSHKINNISKASIIEKTSIIDKYKTSKDEAEVDLHIDKLVNDISKIDDSKKLKYQIDFFEKCLESAIENSLKRVIFIHGVGVGVLKMEIHKILNSYENVEYRDASISVYGIGATEVLIRQK